MRLVFLAFLFFGSFAQAQSLGDAARSARSRAMGGVFIPFVRDAEAVFINPAALGYSPTLDLRLIDLGVSTNTFTVDHVQAFQDIDASDPSSFNQFYGEKVWARATGKVAVSVPYLAMGYLNNAEVSLELHNPVFPQFNTYFVQDEAIYLGGALPLGPASYLGLSAKRINRWGGTAQELSVGDISGSTTIQDIGDRFSDKGQGFGLDVSVMTELPTELKPTLALVLQDIGNTAFNKTSGTNAPPSITQNLTFAGGVGVDLPGLDWLIGFEARHLLEPEMQIGKKLHLGTEVSLPLIDLRAGYSQGYLTYGVGVNLLIFHIDAVSYSEETGVYPGQSGDPRYMVSLSIDLSFDADFKFTDNNGKKRRVKQRR